MGAAKKKAGNSRTDDEGSSEDVITDLSTPEEFLELIKVDCNSLYLEALNNALTTFEDDFLMEFIEIGGFEALLDILSLADRKNR